MLDSIRFRRFSFHETLDREKREAATRVAALATRIEDALTAPAFDQAAVTALAQRAHYAAAAAALECAAARSRAYEQRNLIGTLFAPPSGRVLILRLANIFDLCDNLAGRSTFDVDGDWLRAKFTSSDPATSENAACALAALGCPPDTWSDTSCRVRAVILLRAVVHHFAAYVR